MNKSTRSTQKQPLNPPSRLSASTDKQTGLQPHSTAVRAIKDMLYEAHYRCCGEANGTIEAFVGGGQVPVILVQTYSDNNGVEVWQPVYAGIATKDTIEALRAATTPTPQPQSDDAQTTIAALPAEEESKTWTPDKPMNEHRAEWAKSTLQHFAALTGCDIEDAICDLLADIMHYCDRNEVLDIEGETERAKMHYAAEVAEEAEQIEDEGEQARRTR